MAPPCVAVFAHNEEGSIRRCLESLWWATRRPEDLRVRVLVNGCRDGTEAIVRAFAQAHPQVEPVVLGLGDKANAWNTYVHGEPTAEANHYFLDGDTWLPPHALDVLERAGETGIPEQRQLLGDLYLFYGDAEKAASHYRAVLAARPGDAGAASGLAACQELSRTPRLL